MTLDAGDDAPEVTAQNQHGETVSPSFEAPTVVYFYPRDDTPGCTIEAKQFNAELESYRDAGATVYGVSTDDVDSHDAFADKFDLEFDLLADPDGEIADSFGVEIENDFTQRTTFVLADGEVQAVYPGVDPDGHAREVLQEMLDDELVVLD
ncbi:MULTISPECIES: peroxiredoxin [unclassified Haladaptatus]|uniref:peroxiredoxin n=1 Tax=unclassified Haladaptatus TaxID=2622732 RepID=UPI00209BE35A|nr:MULTISPECIES: peroxiredoxin [unclassified Haladaptatus]MCO8242567.1 peroxiredoxin [Haladaptatus sp. AB643]MCO8252324.1 peroxiredoxin [Haladaptatus sp. AB618]